MCWVEISQYAQLGGNSNLDPGVDATGRVGRSPNLPQNKPLKTRRLDHGDALHHRRDDLHAPEGLADEMQPLGAPLDVEDLQDGAPRDDGVDVPFLHDDAADAELPEAGEGNTLEVRRARELPDANVEAGEGGDPEKRVGEGNLLWPCARTIDEDELLDALGREEAEPALELRLVRAQAGGEEVGAAEWPRVRGEGFGHRGGDGRLVGERRGPVVQEVGVNDGERRVEPDPAPARGEHGGARGFLEGEAGDDVAEECVGEAADAVDAAGGGGGGGTVGSLVDGRVGDVLVDVREQLLRVPHVAGHRGVEVGERRPAVGGGRRRR